MKLFAPDIFYQKVSVMMSEFIRKYVIPWSSYYNTFNDFRTNSGILPNGRNYLKQKLKFSNLKKTVRSKDCEKSLKNKKNHRNIFSSFKARVKWGEGAANPLPRPLLGCSTNFLAVRWFMTVATCLKDNSYKARLNFRFFFSKMSSQF